MEVTQPLTPQEQAMQRLDLANAKKEEIVAISKHIKAFKEANCIQAGKKANDGCIIRDELSFFLNEQKSFSDYPNQYEFLSAQKDIASYFAHAVAATITLMEQKEQQLRKEMFELLNSPL